MLRILDVLKYKLRYGTIVEWYNFWYIVLRKKQKIIPKVASIDDTIHEIVYNRCSISRFGDGEVLLTNPQKEIGFQKGNFLLAERLQEVLISNDEGHLVCLSDTFRDLNRYNHKARRFWRTHFFLYGSYWDKYLVPERQYYNTFVTRPYMDFALKEQCGHWFEELKAIWADRDIIFVEGEKSRLGVGNDLFSGAKSIRRVLCPPKDAYSRYDDILSTIKNFDFSKDVLFLIALGPTATVLSYDLFKTGYQAVDIGHVDVEYEWWRMGAKRKVKLEKKYVNEAADGKNVADAGDIYKSQIIAKIL